MSKKKRGSKNALRRTRRLIRFIAKRKNRRVIKRYALIAILVAVIGGVFIAGKGDRDVNYAELLAVIASGESKGNYNAYYGSAGNTSIDFTTMTVQQVLDWQADYVAQGSPSNAVGKYQFVRPTLVGLVHELGIGDDERFNASLQDRLAIRLIERRGVHEYMHGRISREQLAHNLSKEWAALPRVIGGNPAASYYDGDGLNVVQVRVDQVLAAIDSLHASA